MSMLVFRFTVCGIIEELVENLIKLQWKIHLMLSSFLIDQINNSFMFIVFKKSSLATVCMPTPVVFPVTQFMKLVSSFIPQFMENALYVVLRLTINIKFRNFMDQHGFPLF